MKKYPIIVILVLNALLCFTQESIPVFSIRYKTFFREAEDDAIPASLTRQLDIMSDGSSAFYPYLNSG